MSSLIKKSMVLLLITLGVKSNAQKIISYSIDKHMGRYTKCTDSLNMLLTESLSINLAKTFYKLNDIDNAVKKEKNKELLNNEYFQFDSILILKKRKLSKRDICFLTNFLDSALAMIYRIAGKDSILATQSNFKKFKIIVDGVGMNITAPEIPGQPLKFSQQILENIFKNSLVDMFFNINDGVYGNDLFESDDEIINSPLTFLQAVKNKKFSTSYCLPYISSIDALDIINSGKYFYNNLTHNDSLNISDIQSCFESKEGEIICYQLDDECFYQLFDNYIDNSKLDGDLKLLVNKINKRPVTLDEVGDAEELVDLLGHMEILSNFFNMELYKYVIFVLAHEAYHVWFPEIGTESEYKADYFAELIYLKVFQDDKFKALLGVKPKINEEDDTNVKYADEDEDEDEDYWYEEIMGRSITGVLETVLKKTGDYEKKKPLHPSVENRIIRLQTIINERSNKNRDQIDQQINGLMNILVNQ